MTVKLWQTPEHAAFFERRPEEDRLRVQLTALGTQHVWNIYLAGRRQRRWPLALLTFDGNPYSDCPLMDDPEVAESTCMLHMTFVYNCKTRAAWRPVWGERTLVEQRDINNVTTEPVIVLGWKSFMEGWENRPRAKLFAND